MQSYNGFTPQERERGGRIIREAVKRGELPNQMESPCTICGQDKGIRHYHCEDYSPENILNDCRVVCWRCHMMIHKRLRHPKSFGKYMLEVTLYKKQYPPVFRFDAWEELDQHLID